MESTDNMAADNTTAMCDTGTASGPDAASLAMLANLQRQVAPAPGSSDAQRRQNNRELLVAVMFAPTERERNRAAETLRRQIKTLCAAVVDRHTSALTSQEAEDLTQEVFIRLLTSQADHTRDEVVDPTPAYISRVAVNLIIDRRRFLKRRGLEQIPACVEDEAVSATLRDSNESVEDTVIGSIRTRELKKALAGALSPTEAKVLWLRAEGASHDEIASDLGIKEPNARKHLERGLKRMRRLVDTNAVPLWG